MFRICTHLLLFPVLAVPLYAQWDATRSVKQSIHRTGVGSSYYWGGASAGKGLPGWPANPGPGFHQGSSLSVSTDVASTVSLDAYSAMLFYGSRQPFVTHVEPVVIPSGGGRSRTFAPSPIAVPSPSKKFYSDPRYRNKRYR